MTRVVRSSLFTGRSRDLPAQRGKAGSTLRSLRRLALVGACAWWLAGCSLVAKSARSSLDAERVAHAREVEAERRAPLAYGHYQKAQRAAQRSDDESLEHADYASEARLWLELAIAEAERQRSSERRLESERALAALDAKLVELERQRAALATQNELAAARAIARTEAERALARAAQRPALRVKLSREDVQRAAEALLTRAELVALTLESFGKQGPELTKLKEKLVEAKALLTKEPEASLTRADQTLFFALSQLVSLRAAEAAPTSEEKATLAEELALAGMQVERDDLGLTGSLPQAFQGGALSPAAQRITERVCALAKAHPSGRLKLSAQGPSGDEAATRTRALRARFAAAGCSGERFAFEPALADGSFLLASFLAY